MAQVAPRNWCNIIIIVPTVLWQACKHAVEAAEQVHTWGDKSGRYLKTTSAKTRNCAFG
jgi:hypothetical protein